MLDPSSRLTAEQGLRHPWITSSASSSSLKNLHRSVSQNWLKSSSRINSARSISSQKSNKSARSGKSVLSLRRSNNTTVSQDAGLISALSNAPAQEIKQGGSKCSGLKESNVKLTKQLVEKLNAHSVIDEDDRELLQSTSTENESASPEHRLVECEHNRERVRTENTMTSNSQTIVSNREFHNPNEHRKLNSLVLDYASHEVTEEKSRSEQVPTARERSHVIMRDNFLDEHHQVHDPSHGQNFLGTSPSRLHPLSPSPRKNKVYCTYDTV